jgi:hypothetical protein
MRPMSEGAAVPPGDSDLCRWSIQEYSLAMLGRRSARRVSLEIDVGYDEQKY